MARIIFSHGGDYGDNGKGEQNYIKILGLIEHRGLFQNEGYKKLILENPFEVLENHPVVLNVAPFGTGNAGNNIYMLNGKKMATHLLPPGTLHTPHTISLLGALKAVDLEQLEKEIVEANSYGAEIVPGKNLFIDQYATLTIPQDIAVDRAVNKHMRGTCKGSGPSMARRALRFDARAADLSNLNEGSVSERIGRGLELYNPALKENGERTYDIEETIGFLEQHAKNFGDGFVVDGEMLISKARKNPNADIYVNGTQGLCLDLNVGSIGNTVSYGTSIHDASIGCYFSINIINECGVSVVIVKKAYVTRAGTGLLPGEFEGEKGKRLSKIGGEIGVTSGNIRRTGPDNLAETRYQVRVFAPGITNIRKTKVDIYGEFMDEFWTPESDYRIQNA